jgi:enoyl-CoA hydratase
MTNSTTYSTILTERIGGVERLTLNRPEKRNALSGELQDELLAAVRAAERSGDARVIIIRGAGPSFCAGYDLNPGSREGNTGPRTVEQDVAGLLATGDRWRQVWNCAIPVIAQVHGNCIAGGTDLALHCDFLIAADDAQIGFPPVRSQGTPPTHMWLYNAGPQWSKRMLLTGDKISGTKAAEIGLALESVPADDLDEYVLTFASRMALIGHDLLVHNKRIVNLGVELMGRGALQMIAGMSDALGHLAPEASEFNARLRSDGVRAAVADRDAPFEGR